MAKKSKREQTKQKWNEVLSWARKIRDSGHMVVFTSPVEKDGLTMAKEIANAIASTPVGPQKAAASSGKRFTAL